MGDDLDTIDMGLKVGAAFLGGDSSEAEATAGHNRWRKMAHCSLPNN